MGCCGVVEGHLGKGTVDWMGRTERKETDSLNGER